MNKLERIVGMEKFSPNWIVGMERVLNHMVLHHGHVVPCIL